MIRGLEHMPCEGRQSNLSLFILRKKKTQMGGGGGEGILLFCAII